ncbi:MAG: VOC family protein [Comamonas sp.]|nr:VOC family protein [Comamonas sp.]
MLTHLLLGTNHPEASRRFYDAVLGALGTAPSTHIHVNGFDRFVWSHNGFRLLIAMPRDGEPATHYNGFTLGLAAASPEQVDQAVAAALAHGGTQIEDPPGWREGGGPRRYLAYVRDPDGHKLCIIHKP